MACQPAAARHRLDVTAREAEVLSLLASGRTNREIACALYISGKTASVDVSRLLRKVGASNRVGAAAIAQRLSASPTRRADPRPDSHRSQLVCLADRRIAASTF